MPVIRSSCSPQAWNDRDWAPGVGICGNAASETRKPTETGCVVLAINSKVSLTTKKNEIPRFPEYGHDPYPHKLWVPGPGHAGGLSPSNPRASLARP